MRFSPMKRLWLNTIVSFKTVTSFIVAVCLWRHRELFCEGTLHEAASAFAAIAATLLGFMIAALSILTSIVNQKLVRNMQKTGHYARLLSELYQTAACYALVMVVALFSIFLSTPYVIWGMTAAVFAMTFSTAMMISVGQKFWKVLLTLNPEIINS